VIGFYIIANAIIRSQVSINTSTNLETISYSQNRRSMDFIERLGWRGLLSDSLKLLLLQWKTQGDELEATISKLENENESNEYELRSLKDQLSFVNRTINDSIASQMVASSDLESLRNQQTEAAETELEYLRDIQNLKQSQHELVSVLEEGYKWPEDKLELRNHLEHQKHGLLTELNENHSILQTLRDKNKKLSERSEAAEIELNDLLSKIILSEKQLKTEEDLVAELRARVAEREAHQQSLTGEVTTLQSLLYEKQRLNRSDEAAIKALEAKVLTAKHDLDASEKEFKEQQRFVHG
jgi:hypothetical protein